MNEYDVVVITHTDDLAAHHREALLASGVGVVKGPVNVDIVDEDVAVLVVTYRTNTTEGAVL